MRMPAIVSPSETIRPLRDKILVKPLQWEPSKILEVIRHGRPLRGQVIAVGPGDHPKKYKDGPKGKKSLMDYSKRFQPLEVKPGDIVELGGLNIFDGQGYGHFTEVMHGNELLLLCQEADICGIVEPTRQEHARAYNRLMTEMTEMVEKASLAPKSPWLA